MSTIRVERIYEKYAWVIIAALGALIMVGGIPHTLGVNSDPTTPESIIGMGLNEFEVSNPMFFDLYDFYFRAGGWSDMGFAFYVIVISATAYRKGEKWAWYILWSVPAFLLGHAAITMSIGPSIAHLIPFLAVFVTLSLLGLLLPVRRFFPKEPNA
ncbi:MAG: hypothetical protein NWE89_01930 [Candidatus Bathyarchaeota archaeon]|nr:hypothetical protein [Candidatus Bathyarchaeota archaeon]